MSKRKKRKLNKAFTLIELLVVIAIIGLLASITLVALKSVREKAKTTVGLQFEAQVHHALGAYAVGVWDFDDQASPTSDTSGNGNDGTINGATWRCANDDSDYTPSGKGCSLEFDGDDYIQVPADQSLYLSGTQEVTITAWINPNTLLSRGVVVSKYAPYLARNGSNVFFNIQIDGSSQNIQGSKVMKVGKWHHIVGTYNGTSLKVYSDGVLDNSREDEDVVGNITCCNSVVYYIGMHLGWSTYPFDGLIDNVRIYKQALSSAQIEKLYVEGARKKGLTIK